MEAKRRSINEMHTDTRILINYMETKMIKERQVFVSYADLSAAIGRDIRNGSRGLLNTARKHIETEHKVLLEAVRNEGVKCTTDYVGKADQQIKHVGKTTRRELKRIVNATTDEDLSNGERIKLNARLSQLGAFAVMAKPSATHRLESSVEQNMTKELPTAETFKLFVK